MAPHKILMLTNAELGQANVFIATTHSLLEQDSQVDIHIASFPSLQKTLNNALNGTESSRVTFHPLPGRTMFDCFEAEKDPNDSLMRVSSLKPGFKNTPLAMKFILTKGLICWAPDEFAEIFHATCALIKDLNPDLVVVDMLFSPGVTAAKHLRKNAPNTFKFAILSPNSLKDYIHHLEPKGAVFWKWPITGSGLPMPIPWYLIWLNVYLAIRMIWIFIADKSISIFQDKVREASHLSDLEVCENISMVNGGLQGVDKVFIGGRPEVEFAYLQYDNPPKEYMSKIVGCGPILRPIVPIDSELEAWLKRGPVIFISLGSHCLTTEEEALDMARSLKYVIDEARRKHGSSGSGNLQVLWKMQKDFTRGPEFGVGAGSAFYTVLGRELDEDRVRIVNWLSSEPNSILNTGDVICNISHGGANSFYEAVW